jgi:hypothetical protein
LKTQPRIVRKLAQRRVSCPIGIHRLSRTVPALFAYLRNCANTTSTSVVWESQGPREKTSDIKKSGGKIFQSALSEKSAAETRGVNHGSSGTIRPGSGRRCSAEVV